MLVHARASELKELLQSHNKQTQGHIARLQEVFELLGKNPARQPCDAARGLAAEWRGIAKDAAKFESEDWVIASPQAKIVASYRGLVIGAKVMRNEPVANLLRQNLRQEEQTADKVQKALACY